MYGWICQMREDYMSNIVSPRVFSEINQRIQVTEKLQIDSEDFS